MILAFGSLWSEWHTHMRVRVFPPASLDTAAVLHPASTHCVGCGFRAYIYIYIYIYIYLASLLVDFQWYVCCAASRLTFLPWYSTLVVAAYPRYFSGAGLNVALLEVYCLAEGALRSASLVLHCELLVYAFACASRGLRAAARALARSVTLAVELGHRDERLKLKTYTCATYLFGI